LTVPGPQFLYFLEQGLFDVDSDPGKELDRSGGLPSSRKVVIDGKRYLLDFTRNLGGISVLRFWGFLERFNKRPVLVKDGQAVPHKYWNRFPKELIWFYGVERLRIMEEGEAEDWKKLPMLLWE
jgi:hypothetical protein